MAETALQLPETPDTNKALALSLGMASPLWFAFTGAAVAGSAFWWMSRWTRPENLEAMFDLPKSAPAAAPTAVPAVLETAAAVVTPVAEIAVKAATTAVEIAASETAALAEALVPAEPVVEPLQAAAVADDLTKLVGIGPKMAASLAEMGVTSFAQIAAWTADDVAKFDEALSLKGRAGRDAWIAQARRFAEG